MRVSIDIDIDIYMQVQRERDREREREREREIDTHKHTHSGALDDLELSERDAAKCMQLMDTDEDGTIVKDEFLQLAMLVTGIMDVREKEENLTFLQQVLIEANKQHVALSPKP